METVLLCEGALLLPGSDDDPFERDQQILNNICAAIVSRKNGPKESLFPYIVKQALHTRNCFRPERPTYHSPEYRPEQTTHQV